MLIVEDGTGVVGAESYVSVAEADQYMLDFGYDEWPQPPASTPSDPTPVDTNLSKKEAMLRRGALYIDNVYGILSVGYKKNSNQGLLFPQIGAFYWNGMPVDPDSIPIEYKKAQMEVARLAYAGVALTITIGAGERELKRKKIDVIEKEWFESDKDSLYGTFGWIDALLVNLFGPRPDSTTIRIARIVRA